MAATAHSHSHRTRALGIAVSANAAFAVVEIVGGIVFGSLALVADAAHMLVDVVALSVAIIAQVIATRPATARHTYGLQRAEVLAALGNGLLVLVLVGFVAAEALDRLNSPTDVSGRGVLVVASLGLLVNLGSAGVIARVRGDSLNMRGALLHMLADAGGSLAAIAAGAAAALWGVDRADPVASLIIVALLVWAALGLVRDAVQVLMEAVPRGMDAGEVERALVTDPDVDAVHHLHLWNLGSETPALSAHVILRGEKTLHDAQVTGERLKALLVERFGIGHSTIELECHACLPEHEIGS